MLMHLYIQGFKVVSPTSRNAEDHDPAVIYGRGFELPNSGGTIFTCSTSNQRNHESSPPDAVASNLAEITNIYNNKFHDNEASNMAFNCKKKSEDNPQVITNSNMYDQFFNEN